MAVYSEIPIPKHEVQIAPGTLAAEITKTNIADVLRILNSDAPSLEMVDRLYTQTAPTMDANAVTPARTQQLGR